MLVIADRFRSALDILYVWCFFVWRGGSVKLSAALSVGEIQKDSLGGMVIMTIRTMNIEDFEEIYDLWIHTEGMGLNTTDDSKDGIVKYLLRNPNTCFVAEDNGKLIGVIISGHDGRRGFIYHTTVKKEYRGQGIGKKLVDSAMKALEAEGIHKVALVAFEKNVSGNAFWEKVGFTVRDDLVYRNKNIHQLKRVDLI